MKSVKSYPPVSPYRQNLHKIFVESLRNNVSEFWDMSHRPFFVRLQKPFNMVLEVYMFPALNPPGGRNAHEYKINLLLQGHLKQKRMNFPSNDNYPILVAYEENFDVFILLDAYAHKDFSPNTNIQFKDDVVLDALTKEVSYMIKGNGEVVIAAKSNNLINALEYRILDEIPDNNATRHP